MLVERFWIFCCDVAYPQVGVRDLIAVADTFEEAVEVFEDRRQINGAIYCYQIVQVVDNKPMWIWEIECRNGCETDISVVVYYFQSKTTWGTIGNSVKDALDV